VCSLSIVAEQILKLFPLQHVPPLIAEDSDNEQRLERLKQVQENLVLQKPEPVEDDGVAGETKRPGDLYKRYRTIDELPENAKAYYEMAGIPPLFDS
jgi:RNA polymerase I-specific transcription initiation factor RRN7